mmetsp:Transcript_28060/g.34048  ORF Transcript_28060/g.34048 Transcript_28060/m.34048 type:complete len:213 (+) Transcript_28060:718-1356(+)
MGDMRMVWTTWRGGRVEGRGFWGSAWVRCCFLGLPVVVLLLVLVVVLLFMRMLPMLLLWVLLFLVWLLLLVLLLLLWLLLVLLVLLVLLLLLLAPFMLLVLSRPSLFCLSWPLLLPLLLLLPPLPCLRSLFTSPIDARSCCVNPPRGGLFGWSRVKPPRGSFVGWSCAEWPCGGWFGRNWVKKPLFDSTSLLSECCTAHRSTVGCCDGGVRE